MDDRGVRITGLVAAPATEPLDDETLAGRIGWSPADVRRRTRGVVRTSAPDGLGPAAIAAGHARQLLAQLHLEASAVDQIVFATTTPDLTFPGSACLMQAELGAAGSACLDVRSQCTGFLTAVDVAARFVACGSMKRILVAAADVPTHVVRYDGVGPELAILTGDGGAVAMVEPGRGRGEILASVAKIDGGRYREFWSEFPASRYLGNTGVARGERMAAQAYRDGRHYPTIDLARTRETAVARIPEVFAQALAIAGVERVDVAIIAHVDPDVEDILSEMLASRAGRFLRRKHAYSFGSTLPLALANAVAEGSIEVGQTVAVATAGAGVSWGAMVIRW